MILPSCILCFPRFYTPFVWFWPDAYKNNVIFFWILCSPTLYFPGFTFYLFSPDNRIYPLLCFIVFSEFLFAPGKAYLVLSQWSLSKLNTEIDNKILVWLAVMMMGTNVIFQFIDGSCMRKYHCVSLVLHFTSVL